MERELNLEVLVNMVYHTPSDINEHIPTLVEYASECSHITEMGVRAVLSTWAFLGAAPDMLVSYDIVEPSKWGGDIQHVYEVAKSYGLNFKFIQADVLKIEIDETDLLFIDTWHTYDQLKSELAKHAHKARKYIILHDTTSFEYKDEPNTSDNTWSTNRSSIAGLWPAVEEFLRINSDWVLHKRFTNNNGLTILKRIN